jgi:Domain of Unknown Function (DUF1080)
MKVVKSWFQRRTPARHTTIVASPLLALALLLSAASALSPFSGRWDLTIMTAQGVYPSWMQFADEGGMPVVRVVGRVGSVHPVQNAKLDGAHLTFDDGGRWDITVHDGKLSGRSPVGELSGVQAPALASRSTAALGAPQPLFDGRDLNGWIPDNPTRNHWIASRGELQNTERGANLRTTRNFTDFKLHIEYNCPPGGNSGVYLRGRYEVQVEYEPPDKNDAAHSMGSIYGFLPPSAVVAPRPGQWETYDVTLAGRNVTVIRDGVLIIDRREIPGITGGAIDSNEGAPGPIYLQGDHSGGLKFRNITVSLPR